MKTLYLKKIKEPKRRKTNFRRETRIFANKRRGVIKF